MQRWNEYVRACRKKCEKISDISKDIRYAGVINDYSRTIAEIIKLGVKPLGPATRLEKNFYQINKINFKFLEYYQFNEDNIG